MVLGLMMQIPLPTQAVCSTGQTIAERASASKVFMKEVLPRNGDAMTNTVSKLSTQDTFRATGDEQFGLLKATASAMNGARKSVCADSLLVRGGGAPGYYVGELHRGESFLVTGAGDVFVYGFAYGHVNKWGHVMKKYLC
jgi:hypothetical protein